VAGDAAATRPVRERAPVLRSRLSTCFSTVRGDRCSRAAICLSASPPEITEPFVRVAGQRDTAACAARCGERLGPLGTAHTEPDNLRTLRAVIEIPAQRAESAFRAALDPDRTTELTITATDWTYRPANKYASAQRPLFGRVGRRPTMRSAQIARSVTVEEARPEVGLPPVTADTCAPGVDQRQSRCVTPSRTQRNASLPSMRCLRVAG
jgi:hypothetical protein